ncbi:MAG: hypothetical protein ICV66_03015 [Chitinophagaceae bacterium]|nr:hypothetical protein [Chitinophagaceae bacterium]
MKKLNLVSVFILLFLAACKKEKSIDTGHGNQDNLLVRTVAKSGSDSTEVKYSYDGEKRVSRIVVTAPDYDLDTRAVRNSSGIITDVVQKSSSFSVFGIDSVVTKVSYNSAQSRYINAVTAVVLLGTEFRDSISYQYDAGGKLTSSIGYSDDGTGYVSYGKTEYTYDGNGNITSEKFSEYDGTNYTPVSVYTYTYDTKVNPLKLGNEAIIINQISSYGPNNVIKTDFSDLTDPVNNYSLTLTLNYNGQNKPQDGTAVEQPGGTTYTLNYFYQ